MTFKQKLELGKIHLSQNDKVLNQVISIVGDCRLKPNNNIFYFIVKAIASQQLSSKAADSIFKRFMELYNNNVYLDPKIIVDTDYDMLRKVGLSNAKVKYIKDLCAKLIDGTIQLKKLNRMNDEEAIEHLIKVKGIGRWTAEMVLIFSLGRLNILPIDDQGIKNGIKKLYELKKDVNAEIINKISSKNNWSPYNSIASWYIWKSLDLK